MGKACAAWYVNDDQRFVKLAEVSILTFRKVMGEEAPDVVVLTDNPSLQIKGADRVVNVREVLSASGVYDFPESKFGYLVWLKPLLPMIGELNGYDRLVMIDADIMFGTCRRVSAEAKETVSKFFTEEYGSGVYFMACEDIEKTRRESRDRLTGDMERASMKSAFSVEVMRKVEEDFGSSYCNCGLIGVDLKGIREEWGSYKEKVDFMFKMQPLVMFKYCEQDWLNIMFPFNVLPQATVWFFSVDDKEIVRREFTEKPIMHFTSRTGKRFMESLAKSIGYFDGEGDGEAEDEGKGSKRYCAVFCVDENHLFQRLTEISIASFRKSYKECDCDVVVLTNDLNCKVRGGDKVVQVGGVLEKYGFTKERIAGTRFGKLFGVMTWAKMVLPFVEELKSYDRVVAIDPDIIITDGRIAEFFTDDMEGHLFMGVPDCGNSKVVPRMKNDVARSEICGKWEWNARLVSNEMIEHYCNAGLLALDMKSLTESEARLAEYEESLGFASHHLRNVGFELVDQDWLNYMYEFKTKPRNYMWFYNVENAGGMDEAMALHFVTRRGKAAMVSYVMTGKFQDNFTKAEKRQC